MKHKTSEVVIEERNKTLTSELERQRTKYNEELQEYKQKIKELETSIKDIKTSYETQLQTQKEDYTKKDVELTKTSALQEQQLKFLEEKVRDSQIMISSKESNINTLNTRVKELEIELKNERNKPAKVELKAVDNNKALEVENAVLKKQLEMTQGQIFENKQSYSSIIESVNKNLVEALQEKTALALNNKELSREIDQMQQQYRLLEERIHKLKKYRELVHAAKYIECKGCCGSYTSNVFGAHIKVCQKLVGKKENNPGLSTERGLYTMGIAVVLCRFFCIIH